MRALSDARTGVDGRLLRESAGTDLGTVLTRFGSGVDSIVRGVLETGAPMLGVEVPWPANGAHATGSWRLDFFPLHCRGETVGVGIAGTDLTERKQFEQALQAAERAAQEACKARSQFVAHVSHELRTPIHAVLGIADLLGQASLDAPQRELVESLHSSAELLLATVNDLLDLSKLEAGKLDLHCYPFNVRDALAGALLPLVVRAQAKGLELRWVASDAVPVVLHGDADRFRQILLNVVGNAVRFTLQGTVDVRLDGAVREDGSWDLLVEVADTGIGIAPADQTRVFEPFVQASPVCSSGTGLGLTIAWKLAGMMGGGVRVHSEPGVGSCFQVSLRMEAGKEASLCTADSGACEARSSRPLRVLVVEDNAVNRLVAQRLLERMGHEVHTACDGQQAVEAVKSGSYDLVLMDVMMPRMDGLQATAAIRDEEKVTGSHVPIVALTAHTAPGDDARCLHAGMNGYLPKPIRYEDLESAISRFTGR